MMYIAFRTRSWVINALALALLAGVGAGCKTDTLGSIKDPAISSQLIEQGRGNPTIYYIGESAILTFNTNQELVIPINGTDLYQNETAWSVRVEGAAPAIRGQDYQLRTIENSPDDASVSLGKAEIVLLSKYLTGLQDGDTLTVNVSIMNNDNEQMRKTLQAIQETENVISNALTLQDVTNFNTALAEIKEGRNTVLTLMPATGSPTQKAITDTSRCLPSGPVSTADEISRAKPGLKALAATLARSREPLIQESIEKTKFPVLTSGFRSFQLYSVDGYRNKFLHTRLALNEIKAFPLPDDQTREIFGNVVVEHFYVVAFSAQNDSGKDKIINTGLINAYGKAIVYGIKGGSPICTIPVQVPPESMQQVYSIVSGTKWNRPREWIFRSLAFGGGLATAIATGFGGSPDLIKALGIYSGVGIPSLQLLWPDQVPNYLGNIVNFGMPELVKIPQNGTIGYKLLFFSKDNLHSMISDPATFGGERLLAINVRKATKGPFDKPHAYVVYLSFDTLEVPFQVLQAPTNAAAGLSVTVNPSSSQVTTNNPNPTRFVAVASGLAPFRYQWLFNDTNNLQDGKYNGANISGATNAVLELSNLATNYTGKYSVRVLDAANQQATSSAAELKVQQ